jgi:hypothetical protein
MGDIRNACKTLVEELQNSRLLEQHSHRWEDNVKMGVKGIVYIKYEHVGGG